MSVLVGRKAPSFSANAVINGGEIVGDFTLEQFKGKYVVLFFYPKDFTFVCPTELFAFQEKLDEFKSAALELIKNSISEDGCIEYNLYENNEDAYSLTFVEKWRDQEAVNQHGSTDLFKKSIEKIQNYSENLEISLNSKI